MSDSGLLKYNVNLVRPPLATKLIIFFCSVSIFFAVVNLLLHICFKSLRVRTGSTLFYIIISELLFTICFMLSAYLFSDFNPIFFQYPEFKGLRSSCENLAGFTAYFYFLSRMYSACISHELQLVIQNPTYNSTKSHCWYHIMSNGVSLLFLGLLVFSDNLGMSSTLMCWNKYTPNNFLNNILVTVFLVALVVFTIFNLYFLWIKTPRFLRHEFKGYLVRYTLYLITAILVDIARVVQMFVACLSLKYFGRGDEFSMLKKDGYEEFRWISVAFNIFTPVFLSALRLTEPEVIAFMRHSVLKCCRRVEKKEELVPHKMSLIQLVERKSENNQKQLNDLTSLQFPRSFTTVNTSTLVSESDKRVVPPPPETRLRQKKDSGIFTVKEHSVLVSINTILTGICYSLQEAEFEGIASEAKQLSKCDIPSKHHFQKKFSSVLGRKHSLREVYRNDLSKQEFDLVSTRNRNFDIMIKQYAPSVFERLRLAEDITTLELIYSLSPGNNEETLQSFSTGAGKSHSFFFFTQDLKYAIKTINSEEYNTLMNRLLPSYYQHVLDNPDSMLARILGVFSVRASHMDKIYIVIMRNLLGSEKQFVRRIYDLKGSTFKRTSLSSRATQALSERKPPPPFQILKDLDLLKLEEWIYLSETSRSKFVNIIQRDTALLQKCNLMDYSLLVVRFEIPSRTKQDQENQEERIAQVQTYKQTKALMDRSLARHLSHQQEMSLKTQQLRLSSQSPPHGDYFSLVQSELEFQDDPALFRKPHYHFFPHPENCKVLYCMAIIDFLQNYNFRKQMEYQGRKLVNPGVSPNTLSVQNPQAYGERFAKFMEKVSKTPQDFSEIIEE